MTDDASRTTPPCQPIHPPAAPPVRHSQRARALSERARANTNLQEEEEEADTNTVEIREQNGTRRRARKGFCAKPSGEVSTAAAPLAMGAVIKKLDELVGMGLRNQDRTANAEAQNKMLLETLQQYKAGIAKLETRIDTLERQNDTLLQVAPQNETRIAKLKTQNQTLMDIMKKSANEQVKMTQSWAQVVAGAPGPPNSSPTPAGSSPSVPSGSLKPNSSVSQTSALSRSAIILDLAQTVDRVSEFSQLKDKVNDALGKHEMTKEVRCTGLQRRMGGEDQAKITFASEEAARKVRRHGQWLQEPRFREARMLGEQWYPIKVDRVNRASISPNFTTEIAKEAMEAIAQENGVKTQRIRWLSKSSDKAYGSVVVFLADHQEAEALLAKGMMDFGGETAYTRPYERRQGPTRCFKCHGYGHVEARCKATAAVCGKRARTGHTIDHCTSTRTQCAACQGPHRATDRTWPKYMELLRRFNPVERHV